MAKNVNHVSHIKSTSSAITSGNSVFIADGKAGPKLPVASTLIQGEIAVNLAKDVETLSIVNTSGEIVTFSSDKIIKKVIVDNEQVTSAALNDLNNRKLDASAYTQPDLSAYATEEWVSDRLGSGFTGDNSGISVTQTIEENGLVVAAALNDLNNRKLDASAYTPADLSDYYTKSETDELLSAKADTTWVEEKLGSGFTGDNSGNTVTKVIEENELVVAAALNDLETKKLDASAYTPTDLSDLYVLSGEVKDNALVVAASLNDLNSRKLDASAYTQVEIDTVLDSGSTNPVANSAITTTILENEEVVAEAIADLDSRISGNTTYITQVNAKADTIARSLSGYTPSGYSYSKSEVEAKLNNKLDASAYTQTSIVELDNSTEYASGDVPTALSVRQAIVDNELVVASALNDLEERKLDVSAFTETSAALETLSGEVASAVENLSTSIDAKQDKLTAGSGITIDSANTISVKIDTESDEWTSGSTGVPATSALAEVLEEIEEVTATALNDLNDRLLEVSGSQLTASSFKTINGQTIVGSGNISIEGSGGGQANVIETVKVNGNALTPDANKAVNITDVPASIVSTSTARTFVSNSEKTTWNAVTAKTDTTAFTQHTGDTTIHVTSTEKSTWNGKQDALSCGELKGSMNRNDVSGTGNISVRNTSGEFPTVISEGTYKVVTYMSSTTQSYGLNVNFGGNTYNLTTSNGVIEDEREITITSNKTWSASVSGTVASNTVLIVKLYLISSNVSVLGLVAVSNDYDDLYNKPTIPTSLSDINSAHTHSEYALNTAFTAHTASTNVHVTTTEKSTWNGKQDAFSNASVLSGISSTNVTNWNNAATSAHSHSNKSVLDNLTQSVIDNSHTHSNKSVLDGITTAKTDSWDTVTSKTDNTAFTAHTANTTVHVTAANKTQWNNAISGVSFNGTTATVNNHVAAITATIPAAPGTLTTTATTAQATATNEALSGNIALHKVSKTGSYNDLNNKPTIPTVSNSTVTLTFNGATVGSFTLNGTGGTIDIGTVIGLPSFSAANNGQILGVVNGQLAWVTPTTIYTGTGTPSSSQGNNGDIYLQTS